MNSMKRIVLLVLVIFIFALVGCSKESKEEGKNEGGNTDIIDNQNEKNYFWESEITDDTIAILLNKWTDEQYKEIGETTKVVIEEESQNKILIVSAEDNTDIEIWSVDYKDEKFTEKSLEFEIKDMKKNAVIEVQMERAETIPAYKIKFKNNKGNLDYYITENLKDGNPDIEYLTINIGDEKIENDQENEIKSDLTVGMFIPNGGYEIKFNGSDVVSEHNYIKGDGTSYQVIGTNAKGAFVNVYSIENEGLYNVFNKDLTAEEMNNIESIDYLNEREESIEVVLLNNPIQVGTRWDNKEIVEVGENLKLGDLILEGAYVKTWEKVMEDEKEIVSVYYYSEGLGCVQHRVLIDGEVVEQAIATEVIKK